MCIMKACEGVRYTYRSIVRRIIVCLISSLFVAFTSKAILRGFSSGGVDEEKAAAVQEEKFKPAFVSPAPQYDETHVENTETLIPEFKVTKNYEYFEPLVTPGSINVLISVSEPSGWNFDTILIMSIDKTDRVIRLINLPRDIYIDYNDYVYEKMEQVKPGLINEKGMLKINAAPSIGERIGYKKNVGRFGKPYMDFLCDIIDELFAIRINDFVYLKVDGVRNIIDYFGGVDIYVDRLMNYYDPTQNLDIYLEPGYQHMNGKQAEGFLRFRQGYDENGVLIPYGDIYRKENQDNFVQAFIQQKITLSNLDKLASIADVIKRNVITSVQSLESILAYGSLAEEAVSNKYIMENVEAEWSSGWIDGVNYVLIKQRDGERGLQEGGKSGS